MLRTQEDEARRLKVEWYSRLFIESSVQEKTGEKEGKEEVDEGVAGG